MSLLSRLKNRTDAPVPSPAAIVDLDDLSGLSFVELDERIGASCAVFPGSWYQNRQREQGIKHPFIVVAVNGSKLTVMGGNFIYTVNERAVRLAP